MYFLKIIVVEWFKQSLNFNTKQIENYLNISMWRHILVSGGAIIKILGGQEQFFGGNVKNAQKNAHEAYKNFPYLH